MYRKEQPPKYSPFLRSFAAVNELGPFREQHFPSHPYGHFRETGGPMESLNWHKLSLTYISSDIGLI